MEEWWRLCPNDIRSLRWAAEAASANIQRRQRNALKEFSVQFFVCVDPLVSFLERYTLFCNFLATPRALLQEGFEEVYHAQLHTFTGAAPLLNQHNLMLQQMERDAQLAGKLNCGCRLSAFPAESRHAGHRRMSQSHDQKLNFTTVAAAEYFQNVHLVLLFITLRR